MYAFEHCAVSKIRSELPSLTVVYEDMLLDPVKEVQRVLHFMGREDITDESIKETIARHDGELAPAPAKKLAAEQGNPERFGIFSENDASRLSTFVQQYVYGFEGDCQAISDLAPRGKHKLNFPHVTTVHVDYTG